jgi:hypothetical protein
MVFPGITFKNKDIIDASLITNDNHTYSLHIKDIYIFKYNDSNNMGHNFTFDTNIRATYHIKPNNDSNELGDKDNFVMVYILQNDVTINNNIVQFYISNPPIHNSYFTKIPDFPGLFTFRLNTISMNRFAKWLNKNY